MFYFSCFCNPLAVFFEAGRHTRRRAFCITLQSKSIQPSPSLKFNRGSRLILPMIILGVVLWRFPSVRERSSKRRLMKIYHIAAALPLNLCEVDIRNVPLLLLCLSKKCWSLPSVTSQRGPSFSFFLPRQGKTNHVALVGI